MLVLMLLAGCASKKSPKELLFIVNAPQGEYRYYTDTEGKLTLYNVSPTVGYFTDRPNREGGKLSMDDFLGFWDPNRDGGFSKDPPNAGFIYWRGEFKKYSQIIVELKEPKYDKFSQTLTFKTRIVGEFYPHGREAPSDKSVLHDVILFVDSVQASPGVPKCTTTNCFSAWCKKTPHACTKATPADRTWCSKNKCTEAYGGNLPNPTRQQQQACKQTPDHCTSPSQAANPGGTGGPSSTQSPQQETLQKKLQNKGQGLSL